MEPRMTPRRARQGGTALFIALIMLVAMSIAAVSLVRSVDTTVTIAGNLAFQQAALQAADYGIEEAAKELATRSKESEWSLPAYDENESTIANYRPVMFARTAVGKPTIGGTQYDIPGVPSVDWSAVPALPQDATPEGYRVQYLIDRLCTGTPPITDLAGSCVTEGDDEPGGSKTGGLGEKAFTGALSLRYRVTIRVSGPNNAQSFVQVMLGG
ncbi:pilus assembly protein PilX [Thauera sp. UPWRP]|nr:pilus assembly protein PilX [Thauera sp. UPWRP]